MNIEFAVHSHMCRDDTSEREKSRMVLMHAARRLAAPLRPVACLSVAAPAVVMLRRRMCTTPPTSTADTIVSKPKVQHSVAWDWFLRLVGYHSQESRDDRLALFTFWKCHRHARRPEFRKEYGVVDTFHGTFQLVGLHAWMCHVRWRLEDPRRGNHVASEFFEHWWHQTMLDMKEEGVHDFLQISTYLKELQLGFRGSVEAYDNALKAEDTLGELRSALFRNVYFKEAGKEVAAAKLSGYVEQQLVELLTMKSETFMSPEPGVWDFSKPVTGLETEATAKGGVAAKPEAYGGEAGSS